MLLDRHAAAAACETPPNLKMKRLKMPLLQFKTACIEHHRVVVHSLPLGHRANIFPTTLYYNWLNEYKNRQNESLNRMLNFYKRHYELSTYCELDYNFCVYLMWRFGRDFAPRPGSHSNDECLDICCESCSFLATQLVP